LIDILHRTDNLEVRKIVAGDGRDYVVSFDSYHQQLGFDRPGFGQAYFAERGITAIHVLSFGNDWFQYAEMPAVLALIKAASSPAERVMSYGSSMGGYAALRFAHAVGADAALALSPQWSIDPRKAPFETRWAQDQRRIRFLPELDGPIRPVARMVAAFDPRLSWDRRHAEALVAAAPAGLLPLPYAGHPCGPFLSDIGLLHPLVMTMLAGTFDLPRMARAVRRRKARSPNYLAALAAAQPPQRRDCAVRLSARAVALAPDGPPFHDISARTLAAAGRFPEAIAAHHRAIALEPVPDYRWGLSKTLFAQGDLGAARAVMTEIQREAPQVAGYHAWAAKLEHHRGDAAGELRELRKALALDPGNPAYRLVVRRLTWQLRIGRWRRALLGR
jgi:tetratricopeptide (TPR) repeat protein